LCALLRKLADDPHSAIITEPLRAALGPDELDDKGQQATRLRGECFELRRLGQNFDTGALIRVAMFDIDAWTREQFDPAGIQGYHPIVDREQIARDWVKLQLPPCYHDVDFVLQMSASAALEKNRDQFKAHIWFILEEPYAKSDMLAWARTIEGLDPAPFRTVQVHYTSKLVNGAYDFEPVSLVNGSRRYAGHVLTGNTRTAGSLPAGAEVDPLQLKHPDPSWPLDVVEYCLLPYISADHEPVCVDVIRAMKHQFAGAQQDAAFDVVAAWCATSARHSSDEAGAFAQDRWDRFEANGPNGRTQGIGTLIRLVKEAGLDPQALRTAYREKKTGAAETDDDRAAVERLAALPPFDYDRVRKEEAKRMGVQVSTLDRRVAAARDEAADVDAADAGPFASVQPWPEPVDGAALLDEIVSVVRRFVVCDVAVARAAALWSAMTWLMDVVEVAPIAAITAPERRCGKSQLLAVLGRLSSRPLAASNITPAALFRVIEAWNPTLLLDEADAFMRENEELRGLLNSGHTRDSAFVIRTVGDDHTPKHFGTWGAKAIAAIGVLASTLMDRSIVLALRRKLKGERVEKLRYADRDLFAQLCQKLARWAADNADAVRAARPVVPDSLHDRAADNWEPLAQIAEVAGGAWPALARTAALTLSGEGDPDSGAALLADIQTIFATQQVERISMRDLLNHLNADDEAPWRNFDHGRPMTVRQLGRELAPYDIKSKTVRIGRDAPSGYTEDQFRDSFARYLSSPPITPLSPLTRSQPNTGAGFRVSEADSGHPEKTPPLTLEPLLDKGCERVSGENGETPRKENFLE
jgi:hypothetical protein